MKNTNNNIIEESRLFDGYPKAGEGNKQMIPLFLVFGDSRRYVASPCLSDSVEGFVKNSTKPHLN